MFTKRPIKIFGEAEISFTFSLYKKVKKRSTFGHEKVQKKYWESPEKVKNLEITVKLRAKKGQKQVIKKYWTF